MPLLLRHGHKYLAPGELDVRIRQVSRNYYSGLARVFFRGRETGVWQYHQSRMRELGRPLSPVRLAMAMVSVALSSLLNPKAALAKVGRAGRLPKPIDR